MIALFFVQLLKKIRPRAKMTVYSYNHFIFTLLLNSLNALLKYMLCLQ